MPPGRPRKYGPALPPEMVKARRAARRVATKKGIKAIANRVVNSKLETKFVNAGGLFNIAFNSGISSAASEFFSLIPPIQRGNGSWQMQENSVQPLRITTTWHIGLTNVSRSQNLVVDLYLLQNKNVKFFPSLAGTSVRILKNGQSGETQNYNGFINDATLPVQTNDFTLLKHYKIHLCSNVGLSNGDTTNGNAANLGGNMSYKRITYTYKHKSPLKYNPNGDLVNAQYPNNCAPFWCLGYSKVDGTSPDVANQNVTVSSVTMMTYKDA